MLVPRPDGHFKGAIIDIEKALQVLSRYCELMGVDPATKLPLRSELERLGMKDVADMLDNLEENPAALEEASAETTPAKSPKQRKRKK
jgi:hypothetical protein